MSRPAEANSLVYTPDSEPWEAEAERLARAEPEFGIRDMEVCRRLFCKHAALVRAREGTTDDERMQQFDEIEWMAILFAARALPVSMTEAVFVRYAGHTRWSTRSDWLVRRLTMRELRMLDAGSTPEQYITRDAVAAGNIYAYFDRFVPLVRHEIHRREEIAAARRDLAASGLLDQFATRSGDDVANIIGQFASAAVTRKSPLIIRTHAAAASSSTEIICSSVYTPSRDVDSTTATMSQPAYQPDAEPWEVEAEAEMRPRAAAHIASFHGSYNKPRAVRHITEMFVQHLAPAHHDPEHVKLRATLFAMRAVYGTDYRFGHLPSEIECTVRDHDDRKGAPWIMRRLIDEELRSVDETEVSRIKDTYDTMRMVGADPGAYPDMVDEYRAGTPAYDAQIKTTEKNGAPAAASSSSSSSTEADAALHAYQPECDPWEAEADHAVRAKALAVLRSTTRHASASERIHVAAHKYEAHMEDQLIFQCLRPPKAEMRAFLFAHRLADDFMHFSDAMNEFAHRHAYVDTLAWLVRRMTHRELDLAHTDADRGRNPELQAAVAAEKARRESLVARRSVTASGLLDRVAVKARSSSDIGNIIGQFASAAITPARPIAVRAHRTVSWEDAEARALLAVANKDDHRTEDEIEAVFVRSFLESLPAISNPHPESHIHASAKTMIARRRIAAGRALLFALMVVEELLPEDADQELVDYVLARCPPSLVDFMRVAGTRVPGLSAWQERQAQRDARYAESRANVDAWLVAHPLPAAASSSTPARKLDIVEDDANKKPNNGAGARI